METLILVIHVLAAVAIVGLVLLQHGKGADVGAAFGSGSAGSVFGASGTANFLSRMTSIAAVVFFVTSLGLTWYSSDRSESRGIMANPPAKEAPSLPAQIPPTTPGGAAKGAPPAKAAPGGEPGSKAQDVPK